MSRIVTEFSVLVVCFLGLWLGLSQISFLDEDTLQSFAKDNEKKLGDIILKTIKETEDEIESIILKSKIDSILDRVCKDGKIDRAKIKVHIIRNSEVNAFALPYHRMIIYSGLIEFAKSPEEVAAVMAHEIGHMEKNHVMKKLMKEIGLSMLFTIAGGDAGFEIVKETGRLLSSSAFDREQEREADLFATQLLAAAEVDPEHLANFLFRMGSTIDLPDAVEWISTHPDSKDRASAILSERKKIEFSITPLLSAPWNEVKQELVRPNED